jgi:uncharacterized protein
MAAPHLTTLALEVARGSRRRPHVPEEHGDLLRRKGEEHEAAYLADLRAPGRGWAPPRPHTCGKIGGLAGRARRGSQDGDGTADGDGASGGHADVISGIGAPAAVVR